MTTTLPARRARATTRPRPAAKKPAPPTDPVAEMRAKILAYLAAQPKPVDRGAIKDHLGIDQWAVSGVLDQALKSRRIATTPYHRQIGTLPGGGGLYAATPFKLYALAEQGGSR